MAGCNQYQVTLNDRDVYTPPNLLQNIAVADAALEACISQTIKDKGITKIQQFTQLICTHGGITSLTGIEQLPALVELILSNNELINISPIKSLQQLQVLQLQENPDLPCDQIALLATSMTTLVIAMPIQCDNNGG